MVELWIVLSFRGINRAQVGCVCSVNTCYREVSHFFNEGLRDEHTTFICRQRNLKFLIRAA